MTLAPELSRVLYLPRPGRLSAHVRSRLRPPDIDGETVNTLLAAYGLVRTAPLRNLPNARRNRNLVVETSDGRKILKQYRDDWRPATITFEHSILEELARRQGPGPRLCRTRDGRSYLRYNGHHYALFDFIPGKTYTSTFLIRAHRLRLMVVAGETLARLHRQMQGFLPEKAHHLGYVDYHGPRHRDVAWHVEHVARFKEASLRLTDPAEQPLARQLVAQSDDLLDALRRLDDRLQGAPLPRLVIHGDYGLHNLLFQGAGRATPVDFELARIEWRLSDLVSCLSKLRYRGRDYDFESIRAFMEGYQRAFPIDDEEWIYLPQVWQLYRLMGAVQYWKSYFETNGPARKLASALDSIAQAEWARQQPERILSLRGNGRGRHHV